MQHLTQSLILNNMDNLPPDYREEETHLIECELSNNENCICLEVKEAYFDQMNNNRVDEYLESLI